MGGYYDHVQPEPLSDLLMAALGDPLLGGVVRELAACDAATQAQLIERLDCAQSSLSRALTELRALGVVANLPGRSPRAVALVCREELVATLLAADRLAESVLDARRAAQMSRSRATRRAAVRDASAYEQRADPAKDSG